ncbi:MAG: glutaminase A [Bdellovibrionia bacterium]
MIRFNSTKNYFVPALSAMALAALASCAHSPPLEPSTPGQAEKEPAAEGQSVNTQASTKTSDKASDQASSQASNNQESNAEASGVQASGGPAAAPVAREVNLTADEINSALKSAYTKYKGLKEGKNADYIPALAKVNPELFGISLITADGQTFDIGDTKQQFSIQSISKIFTLAEVLKARGAKVVDDKIGVNATGGKFNSIIAIESNETHRAGNPLVNAGAITTVSFVPGATKDQRWQNIMGTMEAFSARKLTVDPETYRSETETNTRNKAISYLLKNYEVLQGNPEEVLDLYTKQCSVMVNSHDLAVMGATFANGGVNPISGVQVVTPDVVARTEAVMFTAGLYNTSGEWAFNVGAPAKSGVGGGIVAVVPGRFAVSAFSPRLDEAGNSVRAQRAIQQIVAQLGGNLFMAAPAAPAKIAGGTAGQ